MPSRSQNKARCKSDAKFVFTFSSITMVTAWLRIIGSSATFDPLTWRGATKPTMATRAEDAAASPEDKDGNNTTNSSPPQSKKLNRGV
ncbi:MAG: hypothetical protein MJE68_01485 [Proteobacteria bacterium]|nr:hypothetical protein [Pseudomonadota bacterium]